MALRPVPKFILIVAPIVLLGYFGMNADLSKFKKAEPAATPIPVTTVTPGGTPPVTATPAPVQTAEPAPAPTLTPAPSNDPGLANVLGSTKK